MVRRPRALAVSHHTSEVRWLLSTWFQKDKSVHALCLPQILHGALRVLIGFLHRGRSTDAGNQRLLGLRPR